MGEDHVLDRQVIDPRRTQAVVHRTGDRASPGGGGVLAETGVDDQRRVARAVDRPHEIVERHRQIVVVDRLREIVNGGPLVAGVLDRIDPGDGRGHG